MGEVLLSVCEKCTEETGSKDVGLRVPCMTDSLGHTAAPMMRFLLNYFILFYFQGWGA